jgi:hypothetical protein
MTKRFDCREYYEADIEAIVAEMGLKRKTVEGLIARATAKFEKKLKERLGESVTLYDIIPALSGKGDYDEQMLQL